MAHAIFALMKLRRLLKDERGTLIEFPLLLAFVLIAVALIPAYHSVWKAFGFAALYFGGGLAALLGVGILTGKFSDLAELDSVRRVLESGPVRMLGAALWYVFGGAVCAISAAFASIFIAPLLASSPEGQLKVMRALAAAGALAGFFIVYAARRKGPSPLDSR